ncbi:hypothetical protein CDD80_1501 [Ophiocordyceps camponoti-rufipedis]|uniref:Uncharacterized protein n=1 Tax=Ophiocordyceps camponoti-rufipedis TaxID=2004952 RepID=A0A2C5Z651_9HYPO|nr:hypothetical protein CDD80_1501 [Ophiocordyceps camponoti-rufipedis]
MTVLYVQAVRASLMPILIRRGHVFLPPGWVLARTVPSSNAPLARVARQTMMNKGLRGKHPTARPSAPLPIGLRGDSRTRAIVIDGHVSTPSRLWPLLLRLGLACLYTLAFMPAHLPPIEPWLESSSCNEIHYD